MKFTVISDTHGLHEQLGDLPSGGVIIPVGDFCHFGGATHRTSIQGSCLWALYQAEGIQIPTIFIIFTYS